MIGWATPPKREGRVSSGLPLNNDRVGLERVGYDADVIASPFLQSGSLGWATMGFAGISRIYRSFSIGYGTRKSIGKGLEFQNPIGLSFLLCIFYK